MLVSDVWWPCRWAIVTMLMWLCLGCSSGDNSEEPSRSFSMAFTPWPYAGTVDAVSDTYTKIQSHGEIINQRIDSGVPSPEAFANQATYHDSVEGDLSQRLLNTSVGIPVILSVCPLNTARNAPADYWADGTNLPRPVPWNTYDFGDPELVSAYVNFLRNLIARFNPDYCNYGIEATEYIRNNPSRADDLFGFLQAVYDAIKLTEPDLPLFISVTLQAPGSSDAALIQGYASQIVACSDLLGVSTYGYVFYGHAGSGNPANLPSDWLSQAESYAPGLPIAITETGWLAEDLDIPTYSLIIEGSAAWQAEYVRALLIEADRLNVEFVTWFTVADFDILWQGLLGRDPLAQIWRDTGLYDGNIQSREALDIWETWLRRPIR